MYLDNKTIFLAGATGLVGSSILKHIIEHCPNTKVKAVWRYTKPFIKHDRIEYGNGNLCSKNDCQRLLRGCDCAIMAAAVTANALIVHAEPWEFVRENVIMNLRMLEAFHAQNIQRVIFIGSATVYQQRDEPIKEDQLKMSENPQGAYFGIGWQGRFIEKMCDYWQKLTGMDMIVVRAANIFGPYAKFDPLRSNFIPALIRKAVDKMDPFEVWGNPSVVRDVVYAPDFAEAIVSLLNKKNIVNDVFNLGTGVATSVGDVVNWVLKYAWHTPNSIAHDAERPVTSSFRVLDCEKVKEATGWAPRHTIEAGVQETVEWWTQNKGRWKK